MFSFIYSEENFLDDMISEGKNLRGSVCLLHNISITSVVKHGGHGCYSGEEFGGGGSVGQSAVIANIKLKVMKNQNV